MDDIVVIIDEHLPRNSWPKGRIIRVTKSPDGRVRKAFVKTLGGIYERPVTKLARLDVNKADVGIQGSPTGGSVRNQVN